MPALPQMWVAVAQGLSARDIFQGFQDYFARLSLPWPQIGETWASFSNWVAQPHILAVILAWAITFTVVCTIIMCLGFGPAGIVAGTAAAAFQSWAYGGFTPAGGFFATLTSMAMVGCLMPPVCILASILATFVAAMVWVYGAGR